MIDTWCLYAEDDYKKKIADLDGKTKDMSLGAVARNKAVQELAQLKGQDPLPLRRAKITQEAAVRKVCRTQPAICAHSTTGRG